MTRPGTVISQRDQSPSRTAPTDTGVWFVAGLTEKGPLTATAVTSMEGFKAAFGGRVSYSVLSDAVETFFREGGSKCYIARVVGPAASKASVSLSDGTGASLTVTARDPGADGNSLNVQVIAGDTSGTFILVISHDVDGEVERSPELADKTAAIAWAATYSDYVRATDANPAKGDPAVVAATSMSGGDDDRASITDTHRTAALAQFAKELGPGQVSIPGAYSTAVHTGILNHAMANNRVGILDGADTTTHTTLIASATAIRSLGDASAHGALFAPWAVIGGLTGSTTRTVPYSAVQAGLIARSDAATGNPNLPAAGENGKPQSVLSLTAEWTDAQRVSLNEGGVNVAREVYGEIKTYGFRSVADPDDYPLHWMLNNVRTDMAVAAKADAIAERFVFTIIDGQGITISQFGGELAAMCQAYYALGALYGTEPDEAFRVDVGSSVNTAESIAEGRLRAVISLRRSPFAELVEVEIVKIAITEPV